MGCSAGKQVQTTNQDSISIYSELETRDEPKPEEIGYSNMDGENSIFIDPEPSFIILGNGSAGGTRTDLQSVMRNGRNEIKMAKSKLNQSFTTPLVDREVDILNDGKWLQESKDLTQRYESLPPISSGNRVRNNGMAFTA